jgi:uncharacterized protein YoxC
MTDEKRDELGDKIKAWAFPILLAIVGFYLNQLVGELREMKTSISNIEARTTELKKDVEYLRRDTTILQQDVNELKKNLQP